MCIQAETKGFASATGVDISATELYTGQKFRRSSLNGDFEIGRVNFAIMYQKVM